MDRKLRLTSAADFRRVRQTGKSYAHPLTVLIASPNGLALTRYGVTAGKALGGAVRRNRAKRRLRAALSGLSSGVRAGWDLVLVARPGLNEADWAELSAALGGLLRQARILENNQ